MILDTALITMIWIIMVILKIDFKTITKTPTKQHILVHAVKRIHLNKFYIYENIHKFI